MQGVANVLHSNQLQAAGMAQQNAANLKQQMMGSSQFMPNVGGSLLGGGQHASYDLDGEHVTQGILKTFELADKDTFEFAAATAKLLNARIRARWSPNRAPRCAPKHEHVVWQLFNHNWMVDVQWMGDKTGGSEEEWTKQFAKLADRISEARANGDKQYGDEPSVLAHAQQYQQAQMGHAAQGIGHVSSQSGFAQGGGLTSPGGNTAEAGSLGHSLGVGL
jgi:hypothetical protein